MCAVILRRESMEIYLITDLTNGKRYVGKTINTKEQRWNGHLCGDLYVDNAIRKHGVENTTLETLEYVYNEDKLNEREQYWIKELDTLIPNGYNILPGGDCGYGRNTVHEFNREQYLRKIFYPPKRKREAIKCKIYTISSDDLMRLLFDVADFEPYKSNKDIRELTKEEFGKWHNFLENFDKLVYDVVGHNNLCRIAKHITYAPSMRYISDNIYDEYQILVEINTIAKCVHEHMLLRLVDEYNVDEKHDFLYITPIDNIDEYERFAENKIKNILSDWENHPEKLEEIIEENRYLVELKTRRKEREKQEKLKKTISYLHGFLRLYANRFTYAGDDKSGFYSRVSVIFDKYDSGICDSEIESLIKCKDWIINTLQLEEDVFEKYIDDIEFEESLAKNKKWKEYKSHKAERKEREKVVIDKKKTRKKPTTQN